MSETIRCPHCDAKMMEYGHALNTGMASALAALDEARKPIALTGLGLTNIQYTNFYKLRYWGLAEQCDEKSGTWQVTPLGREFLSGRLAVQKKVYSYRGAWRRSEGDWVFIMDLVPGYRRREDYVRDARPHDYPLFGEEG